MANTRRMAHQSLKQGCLQAGKSLGLYKFASKSRARNSRVLVLCYHGIALKDEHLWAPALFISPDSFRRQMEALRRNRCTVLSLEDALTGVATGNLPERATVLTFDDGTYDFYRIVWPILKEFVYPATLYLTTYYVDHQYPVPPGIWSYMFWRARGSKANARELFGKDVIFDLSAEGGRTEALRQIRSLSTAEKMNGLQMNIVSAKLAQILGIDFEKLCTCRILHLLNPEEVHELARDGLSVQLHTHRHRKPSVREAYIGELELNRERIQEMTGLEPTHFCYPSGSYDQECAHWLREYGVKSATTCDPGFFGITKDPLLMPRFLVHSATSDLEFEGWLVGFGAIVSRIRRTRLSS